MSALFSFGSRSGVACRLVAAVIALSTVAVGAVGGAVPAAASGPFGPSGLAGGGFENTLAVAPAGATSYPHRALVGGDTSGVHLLDFGTSPTLWQPSSLGLSSQTLRGVAALAWGTDAGSPAAFALLGSSPGGAAGVVVSTTGGTSWDQPLTDSNGTVIAPGNEAGLEGHPRATGHLIAQLPSKNAVLVGSDSGLFVLRRTSSGTAWCSGVNCSATPVLGGPSSGNWLVRGVYADPNSTSTAWVAARTGGTGGTLQLIELSLTGSGSSLAVSVAASTAVANLRGITVVDEASTTRVYAAAQSSIYRCQDSGTLSCTAINGGSNWAGLDWSTIDGFYTGSNTTLYAACSNDQNSKNLAYLTGNGQCPANEVIKTTNATAAAGSVNWSNFATRNTTIPGAGVQWWLTDLSSSSNLLNGNTWEGAQILVDPGTTSRVYIAGRAGVWVSNSGGAWQPLVDGITPRCPGTWPPTRTAPAAR